LSNKEGVQRLHKKEKLAQIDIYQKKRSFPFFYAKNIVVSAHNYYFCIVNREKSDI